MKARFTVEPLGWRARSADYLMTPIMYLVSGTLREAPQRTHRWNNKKLSLAQVSYLDPQMMVRCEGIPNACERQFLRFHLSILNGWKDYVVLTSTSGSIWHVGWIANDTRGVSRLPLAGPVRMLLGPGPGTFFGIETGSQTQIQVAAVGTGRIGDGGPFIHFPLL